MLAAVWGGTVILSVGSSTQAPTSDGGVVGVAEGEGPVGGGLGVGGVEEEGDGGVGGVGDRHRVLEAAAGVEVVDEERPLVGAFAGGREDGELPVVGGAGRTGDEHRDGEEHREGDGGAKGAGVRDAVMNSLGSGTGSGGGAEAPPRSLTAIRLGQASRKLMVPV